MTRSATGRRVAQTIAALVSVICFGFDRKADLKVFLVAGSAVVHGVSPYVPASDPALVGGHAFVYPWLSAWLFVPLSVLPTWLGGAIFTGLGLAALIGGSRLLGLDGWGVAAVLLCAPVARNMELGAVNALFFFLLAATWHWRERTWVVACAVTLLIGMKLFLAPVMLWVLLTRSWRCTVVTTASVAAFFGVSFGLGPIGLATYELMLRNLSDYMGHRGMGAESALAYLLPTAPARLIVLTLVVLAGLVAVWAYRRAAPGGQAELLGALVVLSLVGSPMVWRHYFVLLFFVAALMRPSARFLWWASCVSWIVLGAQAVPPIGGLSLGVRFAGLYAAVVVLLGICLWDSAQTLRHRQA